MLHANRSNVSRSAHSSPHRYLPVSSDKSPSRSVNSMPTSSRSSLNVCEQNHCRGSRSSMTTDEETVDSNSNNVQYKCEQQTEKSNVDQGADVLTIVEDDTDGNGSASSTNSEIAEQRPKAKSFLNRLSIKRKAKLKNLKISENRAEATEGETTADLSKTWSASNFHKSFDVEKSTPTLEKSWHSSSCKVAIRKATEQLQEIENLPRPSNSEGDLIGTPSGDELDGGHNSDDGVVSKKDGNGIMRRVSKKIKHSIRAMKKRDLDSEKRKTGYFEFTDFSADDLDHSGVSKKFSHSALMKGGVCIEMMLTVVSILKFPFTIHKNIVQFILKVH